MIKEFKVDAERLYKIEGLIHAIKAGDVSAIEELRAMFRPLIYKTSRIICNRYGSCCEFEYVLEQANHLFVCITIMEYTEGGVAHYPFFIQKCLHARLVQMFRPEYTNMLRTIPMDEIDDISITKQDQLEDDERKAIIKKIHRAINKKCTDREKDIVYHHILGNTKREDIAIKYGVSINRIKQIQIKLMKKLKAILQKFGVSKLEDI